VNTYKDTPFADAETEFTVGAAAPSALAADAFAEPEPEVTVVAAPDSTAAPTAATVDPFAAENFTQNDNTTRSIEDLAIELRTPNDEEFVRVSTDPRHSLTAPLLVVSREDGYGKSYHLLTPTMRGWVKNQPSLQKFCKDMKLFLFVNQDGEFGLWPIRDSYDNWSVSDLQVVETAKKVWTRRYNAGKVRMGHTSTSITAEIEWLDKPMFGADGILAQVFGEAFVITSTDNATIKRLLR
jgi:hypothetical protein